MALDFSKDKRGEFESRLSFCLLLITLFFFFVTTRLFYLQIIKGRYFRDFSAIHTMKEIKIPATRGIIFDRHRIPIAENRPSFDLALIPQHVDNLAKVKRTLARLVKIDSSLIDNRWREARSLPRFYPLVIATDIPYDQAIRVRVAKSVPESASIDNDDFDLNGVEVIARPLRSYPQGPLASATLGYIGEVSEKELSKFQSEMPGRYTLGDFVGITGLERYWESLLKGNDGYVQKIVDAVGREITNDEITSFLQNEEAHHGNNLVLTLDSRLQKFAEERFQGKHGALVALDPRNGDVLAIVSLPSYNPSALVSNISRDYWTTLLSDPNHLMLNRAIQGTYPPGSTFKLVTAIAGLEEGVLKPEENISCAGGLRFGGRLFHCWKKGGHGPISVHRAIAESCDTFFYQVGLRLGVDKIAKYAHLLGLGRKTGIDMDGEKSGTIPTAEWKRKMFKQEWQPGENLSIAVGQGYDTVTPMQNALMVSQIALGRKIQPHILKAIENEEGTVIRQPEIAEGKSLPISEKTLRIVRAGMMDAIESPGGTAHGSQLNIVKMAGKTGTAQVISEEGKSKVKGMNTGDHAWFVVYAPVEDPRIAVSVIVEHGGFGASAAAPIAKDVLEKYLKTEGVIQ